MHSVRVRLDVDDHILAVDLWFERRVGDRTVGHHIAAGARSCLEAWWWRGESMQQMVSLSSPDAVRTALRHVQRVRRALLQPRVLA
jgi:hypothetical protein